MAIINVGEALSQLPLNKTVLFDDASICLQIFSEGALLSVELSSNYSNSIILDFLEPAFALTLLYDAGLAIDDREGTLLLSQWLPSVQSWHKAEMALELILNQLDYYRQNLTKKNNATPVSYRPSKRERCIRVFFDR
jgi:hypothetical protein